MAALLKSDACYVLKGQLGEADLRPLRAEFDRVVAGQNSQLCLDLAQLESVSSMVLSLLLCFKRAAIAADVELVFRDIPDALYAMARVGGLEAIVSDGH